MRGKSFRLLKVFDIKNHDWIVRETRTDLFDVSNYKKYVKADAFSTVIIIVHETSTINYCYQVL